MEKIIVNSEQETMNLSRKIAENLKIGQVIVLTGELGSGKTKFTEGILSYFGLENEILSPTFTIVNEYKTHKFPIYHFDVYRLEDSSEFLAIGGDEYFERGVSIIEWGEIIEDVLPQKYMKISFTKNFDKENQRIITIEEIKK